MSASLCLVGLLLFNYALVYGSSNPQVEPSLVKEHYDQPGLQYNEDINSNKTENKKNENVAIEITGYGSNITSEETVLKEIFKENSVSVNYVSSDSSDLENNFNMSKVIFEDSNKETAATKNYLSTDEFIQPVVTGLNATSKEIKDSDKDLNENEDDDDGFSNKELIESTDSDVNSETEETVPAKLANADENADEEDVMLSTLAELDVLDGEEAIEEVRRSTRALVSGIMQHSVLPSLTSAYPNYNMVDNWANIDRSSPPCNGVFKKQSLPVKGKLKIARTFTDFHWNMPPTFSNNGNKEPLYHDDNIATKTIPYHNNVRLPVTSGSINENKCSVPHHMHSSHHGVDKTFLGKAPASGRYTVSAKFC